MANSVGRIYNATLGDSQLQSDGEHTLFTTHRLRRAGSIVPPSGNG